MHDTERASRRLPTLRQLSVSGEHQVPVLGASVAAAHTEQVVEYRREATDELREVWRLVEEWHPFESGYENLVSGLTRYQFEAERAAGLR